MQVRNNSIFVGDETIRNRHTDGNGKNQNNSAKSINGAALTERTVPIAPEKNRRVRQL